QSNGRLTFVEHYAFWGVVIVGFLASMVLNFFLRLTGAPWIWCYAAALFISAIGVSAIFYAKLPLYKERHFFTFASRAIPETRRALYRWGYRCVLFAAIMLLCLSFSRA